MMTEPERDLSSAILNALPHPIVFIDAANAVTAANDAAQHFFQTSVATLKRYGLASFVPFGSPLLALIEQVQQQKSPVTEYRVELGTPRSGMDKLVDLYVSPVNDDPGGVVVMLQERSMADKIDRQLTHRSAARSVTGLAAMLAHEIKNPLSGIRGAGQLLEATASEDDRPLTQLICDEADRIVKLVDRMEVFGDERPLAREAVNIHVVLERVKRLAQSGFARHVHLREDYDPSLPPLYGNTDQLVQVFLNLVKNAAEAVAGMSDGEIVLSTAFRSGVHLTIPGTKDRVSLPLDISVTDNGFGIPDDLQPHLFDPFVTTKTNGTGLGLALVAKLVGDHGGVVECESQPRRTTFRILMPACKPDQTVDDAREISDV